MISVRDLTKTYGELVAIDRLNFEIEGRTAVGFLGANGAGKSTTMRILACYLPATSGEARVGGYDCFTQSLQVRRVLGYMPESVPLYPDMRVEEYLHYMAVLRGVPLKNGARERAVAEALERCHIQDRRRSVIATLSKGLRQRVGLAATLIHKPQVLILDEPTVGLDPVEIRKTRAMIRELAEDHTVLLSTHILPEVEQICSRAIIIKAGRIVADGALDRLVEEQGQRVVEVAAEAPAEALEGALRELPGILQVERLEPLNGAARFRLAAERAADPRPAIGRLLAEKGWPCLELQARKESLEDVYVRITETEKAV